MTSAVCSTPGTVESRTYGSIRILANRTIEGGYAIGVCSASGPHQYEELSYSTLDRDLYRARFADIRDLALAGLAGDQIAQRINQPANHAVADAEQVLTNALAELAATGIRPQLPATRSGAEYTDLTGPQQRAIDAQHNGVITSGRGINPITLKSLARKGYGQLTWGGPIGRRRATLTLNNRGINAKAVTR